MSPLLESPRDPATAIYDYTMESGSGWMYQLRAGQVLRMIDVEGNQAVDTIFYATHAIEERYSAIDTLQRQGSLYLSTGSQLISTEGRVMLTIVADTCGRHDTLGGACAAESNQVRYSIEKRWMHNCRDTYLYTLATHPLAGGRDKRDLAHNVNFFMNVPVTPEGQLTFADGVSAPGRYVELRAEMDVTVLISNCPQLNNPCNAYNPTPARLLVWNGGVE
ncbi:MAG: DUF1989 domain-containing protein [Planctomycetota bacterium]|nr:MAG: DUF1989 domain-containing protein [Planctomycetota bacterium]